MKTFVFFLGWYKGWCTDGYGADQKSGQISLGKKTSTEECLTECSKNDKATGCEFLPQSNCWVHTKDVDRGAWDRDDSNYFCFVFPGQIF